MMDNSGQIDRRAYLKTAGLATAGMAGLAGCTGGDSTGSDDGTDGDGETTYGTLSTSVTDQPNAIGDFESLTVTIDGVWIKPDGGDSADDDSTDDEEMDGGNETADGNETDDDSMEDEEMEDDEMDDENDGEGRRYIEFDEPQDADLVQLQGSNTQLIDETEVEAREYQFLQLDVSNTEGVLTDGSEATVETPGNAPLKFNTSFEIRANERTRFIADFAPNRKGNGGYVIRPVATSTTVLYGDEEYTADGEESTDETDETDGQNSSDTETNETETADNNDN